MSFPPSFLEEIRNRLPLSGIVSSRIKMARAGREYKGCCPFHNEKTPSFYVNDDKQFYHCFGCGAHGDVIGFVMRYDRLSFPEAVENLAGQAGLQVPHDTPIEREKFDAEKRLYQLLGRATAWFEEQLFAPAGREALAYLQGRGLGEAAIRRFRLGYAPSDAQALLRKMTSEGYAAEDLLAVGLAKKAEDRNKLYSFFRNRVLFPVGDRRGRTVAFGARILGEGEPKYLNSPDHALFHKGKLLYGLSRARAALSQRQPIIVVEGYMDAITLAEAGYTGAVAPLGTALTEDQMQVLWKLLPPFETRDAAKDYSPILCFDSDNAGQRAAARAVERALPLLTAAQTIRIATITGAKDPDELIRKAGKSAFDAVIKQAQPMIDALWAIGLKDRPLRTPEERSAFSVWLKRRVGQIKDDQVRELYRSEFKKRVDEAFGWKPKNAGRGWKDAPAPKAFLGARRAPQSGRRVTEKVLLALMINHPELFDSFGEAFGAMEFHTTEFEGLRQQVLDHLSLSHGMTAEELFRALATSGETLSARQGKNRALLDETLAQDTYVFEKAARPEASSAEAEKAWREIWDRLEQEKVKEEYARARAQYQEQPSEENERRLKALQEQILSFSGI